MRVYVDTLFLEGLLRPVAHPAARRLAGSWAAAGVRTDPAADRRRRLAGLLEKAEASLPTETAGHRDWLAFARVWAELNALRFAGGPTAAGQDERYNTVQERLTDEQDERYSAARERLDAAFAAWLERRFSTLHNQPPAPPVMVHHVPRVLARRLVAGDRGRVALVVVDGLSLDQWVTVREELAAQRPGLRCREGALFAWIPTLTMVSRQACFAGRAPFYFPSDLRTTDREPAAWRRFWADEGLGAAAVGYEKNLRGADDLPRVERLVSDGRIRALGLVVDTVDRIMHGMVLGGAGMHGQVRQWTAQGFPAALLDCLLDAGFHVALTADHGNVEARGTGRIAEGAIADLRGQRVRVFKDPALRARVAARAPGAVEWPAAGLPDDYLALLAPGRTAFVAESERRVAHGGAAPGGSDRAVRGDRPPVTAPARRIIGFDRRIRLEWLDAAADGAAAGLAPADLRSSLVRRLEGEVAGGGTPHQARGKTATVLLHVWARVPAGVAPAARRRLRPAGGPFGTGPPAVALGSVSGRLSVLPRRGRGRRPPPGPSAHRLARPHRPARDGNLGCPHHRDPRRAAHRPVVRRLGRPRRDRRAGRLRPGPANGGLRRRDRPVAGRGRSRGRRPGRRPPRRSAAGSRLLSLRPAGCRRATSPAVRGWNSSARGARTSSGSQIADLPPTAPPACRPGRRRRSEGAYRGGQAPIIGPCASSTPRVRCASTTTTPSRRWTAWTSTSSWA